MTTRPFCAYTDEAMVDKDSGQHIVALVEADEPGYSPTTYVGDLDYCRGVVASINESLGVSEEQARDIVASSMNAGPVPH